MTCQLEFPSIISASDTFVLECGPESLIRRFTIKDIQGCVLEDIDQYTLEGNSLLVECGGWVTHQKRGQIMREGNSLLIECGG